MTSLYIGAVGALLFLILTIFSFANKRFRLSISFWKYPAFILPLIVFTWIMATKLYIPFMGNGCSYADAQNLIESKSFSASKKSGILMFFIDGFADCHVAVKMNSGKIYSAKSLNGVFAIVLPSDSGLVKTILVGERGDTISSGMKFAINPGKLTYIGTFANPKGIALLLPGIAAKTANFTYKAPTNTHLSLLKDWHNANRLILTSTLIDKLTELQKNYQSVSQFIGLKFGYLPFTSTSLNGQSQAITPDEIIKDYKDYEFLLN